VIASTRESRVPPYYTLMVQPGSSQLEFVSLRSFVPFSDNDELKTLSAFMTVSSDPSDYGKLRVYRLNNPLPPGPSLADSQMKAQFAQQLTLIDQAGSRVTFGDEQILPIGNNLMYVRTWYVQSTGQTAVPVVRQVSLTYGQSSYLGASLEDVLQQAFGVQLDLGSVVGGGVITPPEGTPGSGDGNGATTTAPPPTSGPAPSTTAPGASTSAPAVTAAPGAAPNVEQLLQQANQAYADAQTALKNGDLGTYQTKINQAYQLAAQAASIATGSTVTAVPPESTTSTTANA
jgi:uncharacterized membrane protein (UPF0182 family)